MTPLCDVLRNYAARNPARFHMPGHKGGPLPLPELSEKPWAERFGFDHCQFLTGGSTMGIHTGLSLLCAPGDRVLVDRNCHRAVFNAMALCTWSGPGWSRRISSAPSPRSRWSFL